MRRALSNAIATMATVAAIAAPAHGADQNVKANLTLSGFTNSNITAAFKSTDVFDGVHSCSTSSSSSCTAQNGYGSPPKNIGNVLCIPNNIAYVISSNCQTLLNQGESQKCHGNSMDTWCAAAKSGTSTVAPVCNWRTNDNTSTVNWNWNLNYQNGVVTVDCSNSNYQGPEQ